MTAECRTRQSNLSEDCADAPSPIKLDILLSNPAALSLGEIRGGEAFDLLQLLNTGHSGTISTVHTNSAAQALSRFTTCVLQSGVEMPHTAIKSNIAESLDIVIHAARSPGRRINSEVLEITGYQPASGAFEYNQIFSSH